MILKIKSRMSRRLNRKQVHALLKLPVPASSSVRGIYPLRKIATCG